MNTIENMRKALADFDGRLMVNVSGGNGSAIAWRYCLDRYGADRVVPVFADTTDESEDTYRFLNDCERVFGQTLVRLTQYSADGSAMGIWDCFDYHSIMRIPGKGNACKASIELKQKPLDAYFKANSFQGQAFGLCPWQEVERCERRIELLSDRQCLFPLAEKALGYCEMQTIIRGWGIEPAEGYEFGAPHNNCLGAGCILQGIKQWASYYRSHPERYWKTEARSNAFFERTGFSLLRDRRGGETRDYTLTQLREEIEAGRKFPEGWQSNCSCMEPVQMTLFDK